MSSLLPVPGTAQGAEWAFGIPIRPGAQLFRRVVRGEQPQRGLRVLAEGGYSLMTGEAGRDLEAVFHTRILAGPHAHQDGLGLTACPLTGPGLPSRPLISPLEWRSCTSKCEKGL